VFDRRTRAFSGRSEGGKNPTVAQKEKYRQAKDDLSLLAHLLNASELSSFQSVLDNMDEADRVGFDSEWAVEAWKVREELRSDLVPLVEGKSRTTIKRHLEQLVAKVSELGLQPYWSYWPATKIFGGDMPNPAYGKLGVGQGILRLGNDKWIVTMGIDTTESPRKYIYGIIISALQSGTFNYFRQCHWKECGRFYVTPDLRRDKYCTRECGKAYDSANAAQRVRKKRKADKEAAEAKDKQHAARIIERNAVGKFVDFLNKSKKVSAGEQPALLPILKKIGGWSVVNRWQKLNKKLSPEEIWQSLTRIEQKVFEKQAGA
jgi:hypothetical protein